MQQLIAWINRLAAMAAIGYRVVERLRAVGADGVITDEELLELAHDAMAAYRARTGHAIRIAWRVPPAPTQGLGA